MSDVILADLRRLYHHLVHGGVWNSKIDTRRLGKAIEEIERLTAYNQEHQSVSQLQEMEIERLNNILEYARNEIRDTTNELRDAKAKITILSDLLTDKCDELKELVNKHDHSWVNQGICCQAHASDYQAMTTMIVCPQCGDKRCARAASCDAECEALANKQEPDNE